MEFAHHVRSMEVYLVEDERSKPKLCIDNRYLEIKPAFKCLQKRLTVSQILSNSTRKQTEEKTLKYTSAATSKAYLVFHQCIICWHGFSFDTVKNYENNGVLYFWFKLVFLSAVLSPSSEKHDFFLKRLMIFGCFRGPLKMYAFPVYSSWRSVCSDVFLCQNTVWFVVFCGKYSERTVIFS